MKKYLIIVFSIVFILLGTYYLYFYTSFTLFTHEDVKSFVKTEDKLIKLNNENFTIKSINVTSTLPGEDTISSKEKEKIYLNWFKEIKEMNLNTIYAISIEEPAFYKALREYNLNNSPLYLIQGIDAGVYEKNSSVSYFDKSLKDSLIKDAKIMIDVIHGKRAIADGKKYPYGNYFSDVSDYCIAYIIGTDWNADSVKYTNEHYKEDTFYEGEYLKTLIGSRPFERVLAEIGDNIFSYESKKYGTQRLLSFNNTPLTDPFTYDEITTDFFNKIVSIDINYIVPTDKVKSGLFASFTAYSNYPNYYSLTSNSEEDTYYKYLFNLNNHYNIPVIISEFGYTTSRSGQARSFGSSEFYTEEEQGEMIVKAINTMQKAGISGFSINEWHDNWRNNIWNTMYAVDTSRSKYFHNVLSANQGYGILSFDSGKDKTKVILDGINNEWNEEDIVSTTKDMSISAKYDEAYIYFMIEKDNLDLENDKIYIPIDINKDIGSKTYNPASLTFSSNADFLLTINGKYNTKLMVNERYDVIRAIYAEDIYKINPYEKENIPNKNTSNFNDIYLITAKQNIVMDDEEYKIENNASLIITGKLLYANADTNSSEYNSLSDFYSKGNIIEIRLPWQLLNFADPSTMKVHDDYYKNYGVELYEIDKISLGIGPNSETITLKDFKLEKWNQDVTYHERLKKSYYIIKEALKGED